MRLIKGLHDCKQSLELEVSQLQNNVKKDDDVELLGYPMMSTIFDAFVCGLVHCKIVGVDVDVSTSSYTLLATNDAISLSFKKHITSIVS